MRMKKLNNKKGFTLAELLIVVAIIAILVAISIPVFTSKLEEARKSTDKANERAAKSAALSEYLVAQEAQTWYYDAENGKLVDSAAAKALDGKEYGKSSTYPEGTNAKDKIIKVVVDAQGKVTISWVDPSTITTQ